MTYKLLEPYRPSDRSPWNIERVVHLHRRAGFAAPWDRIEKDVQDGHEAATDRVVNAKPNADFERMSSVICDAAVGSGDITRLKAWWLYRMLFTTDPLAERLTLCWHNHFATSSLKINDVALMRNQNELLRKFACSKFSELLIAIIKDPAILIWLDADANRKEHPNENLARELMELFTLGVGHYKEADVKESAKILTGWTVARGKFRSDESLRDSGEKTILSKTGNWNGDDLLSILVEHPATSSRIAFRVCELFLGESVINEKVIDELADGLRENSLDIAWAVKTVLRSDLFYSSANMNSRIVSPTQFFIGASRALEILDPPPSTWLLTEWSKRLGEDLFNPPNVFGWAGGRAWLTSRAMIGRANFATALVAGDLTTEKKPFDARALAAKYGFVKETDIGDFYSRLLLGRSALPKQWSSLLNDPQRSVVTLLSSAEGQIG